MRKPKHFKVKFWYADSNGELSSTSETSYKNRMTIEEFQKILPKTLAEHPTAKVWQVVTRGGWRE